MNFSTSFFGYARDWTSKTELRVRLWRKGENFAVLSLFKDLRFFYAIF